MNTIFKIFGLLLLIPLIANFAFKIGVWAGNIILTESFNLSFSSLILNGFIIFIIGIFLVPSCFGYNKEKDGSRTEP